MKRGFVTNELLVIITLLGVIIAVSLAIAESFELSPLAGMAITISAVLLYVFYIHIHDIIYRKRWIDKPESNKEPKPQSKEEDENDSSPNQN